MDKASSKLNKKRSSHVAEIMLAILVIQPALDVLSYFMQQAELTAITTVIRSVLLVVVSLYGFSISDRKRVYIIAYITVVFFWALHMANCARLGYAEFGLDMGEYAKLIQFPLWTLTFISMLKKREVLVFRVAPILTINLAIIIFIIALSFIVGKPVYTYDFPERGIQVGLLGWFNVANSQSAIVAILATPAMLWAYRKRSIAVFSITSAAAIGLLYFTGTRFTYYSALIILVGFIILVLLDEKQRLLIVPLVVILLVLVIFFKQAPMQQRVTMSSGSLANFKAQIEEVMGDDKNFDYKGGDELTPEIYEKLETVYSEVYGGLSISGAPLLGDLIERFGLDKVMDVYNYSIGPQTLYDRRTKHLKCLELIWNEQDTLTKLLGFEYSEVYINGNIYDAENDFPALKFYYGYMGAILYMAFIAYFVLKALISFIKKPKRFLTPEMGTALIMFALALGSAQFSGQVLRKPSVTVYMSLAAALIYVLVDAYSKNAANDTVNIEDKTIEKTNRSV